jgi:AbrB family looped-hinge helix DNA binding protein
MITAKITKKGQITIPKKIREFLNSNVIEFEIVEGKVIVKPVKSVAGSLSKYAKKHVSFEKIREETWGKVADEKTS